MKTCLLVALVLVSTHAVAAGNFEAMDVFSLEHAAEPQVVPGGDSIVYARRSNDVMSDRSRSSIWEVSADGKSHRPLVSGVGNYSSPRLDSDGGRVAYVERSGGNSQVKVLWRDTGQTALLATLQTSPANLSWSPDGQWLAFTTRVKGDAKPFVKKRSRPKGAEWADEPIVVDAIRYQFDGRGIVAPQYSQIFVIPAQGGTPRQLTSGNFNHRGPLSWSPDSGRILFTANRDPGWELQTAESNLYTVRLEDSELTEITRSPGSESGARFSPNGDYVAFLQADNQPVAYRPVRIRLLDLASGEAKTLSIQDDVQPTRLLWREDSRLLYYQFDRRGERFVGQVSTKGGDAAVAAEGLGGQSIGRPYVSGSYDVVGNLIAFTKGSVERPADIAVSRRNKTRVLTTLNEDVLAHKKLGKVNEIVYQSSHDGEEIQGWYITPPDFDPAKKYPLILEIHGGPHAAYGPEFTAELQLMAAAGYVVFYNNYRGSTSYGEAFAMLLQYKYSSPEDFADHMSGIDALIDKGLVDADNLFIAGGSAGGISTAYAIGLTNRFKAAFAAKPVINWVSKTLTADSSVFQIRHQFPDYPWNALEHYWQRSPLSLVGNVTTPTLLLTGEEDRRTPMSETEQYYQALRLQGVDAMMVRLPDSAHGIAARPSRLIAKVDYLLAWFERYRTDKPKAESAD